MKLAVHNITGKATSKKADLSKDVFGIEPNDHAIYLDVKQHLANKRQGNHKSKERAEIVGSTRKIKKQKGTGTARAGSIKNPIFRGGGRIFGPSPRDYNQKVNKKVKRLARKSALSIKAKEKSILIIEDFKKIGYKVDYRLLTASDYGVPQNRQRVFIIGNRINKENPYPEITHYNPLLKKNQQLDLFNSKLKPYVTAKEALEHLANKRISYLLNLRLSTLSTSD